MPPVLSPLGLAGHWYVVCPVARLGVQPRELTACGETARYWLEGGEVRSDRPDLPTVVQDGYLWLWHGDTPRGTPAALPQVHAPRTVWERGTVSVGCGFADFVENTLDLVHPMFAHPYTHPTWWMHALGVRPAFDVAITMNETGWEADAYMFGRRFMWQEFRLPGRVRLLMLPDTRHPMEVLAFHTPVTETETRMEYLMGRRALPWERARFDERPEGRGLHGQDRVVLEGLTCNRGRFDAWTEQHASADTYTLLFRKVLQLARDGRWESEWRNFASPVKLRLRI